MRNVFDQYSQPESKLTNVVHLNQKLATAKGIRT